MRSRSYRLLAAAAALAASFLPSFSSIALAQTSTRCAQPLSSTDLQDYVDAVQAARDDGADDETLEARCGQCVQMIAPHLRHGKLGDHDTRREAFCELVAPGETSFIYTDEDPTTFTGSEPIDHETLQDAARTLCGCAGSSVAIADASAGVVAQSCLANGSNCQIDGPIGRSFEDVFDEGVQTHPDLPDRTAQAVQITTLGEQNGALVADSVGSIRYPQRDSVATSCTFGPGFECSYSSLIVSFEAEAEFQVTVTGTISAGGSASGGLLFGLLQQVSIGQGEIDVVVGGANATALVDETLTLAPGTYQLDVYLGDTISSFASGTGAWDIRLEFD